jgi:hypothetical protein
VQGLDELLRRLVVAKARFVVIGGFAVAAHGAPLVTEDLDVCCPFGVSNFRRIEAALAGINPRVRDHPRLIPLEAARKFAKTLKNLYLQTDLGPLDLLGEVPNYGDFSKARSNSVLIDTDVGPVRVLSIDALIEIKQAIGRPRDRDAVILLKAIKEVQDRKQSLPATPRPRASRRKRR